jgi:hypothetical protein
MGNESLAIKIVLWGLGLSVTGFFFLAMWIRQVSDRTIIDELKQIRLALVGDMVKPGVITILHQQQSEIDGIKRNCEKTHDR